MSQAWTPKDIPSQAGKRIVVTGATSGIGWSTALELARGGAEMTIPARTQGKADAAAARIHAEIPTAKLKTAVMDSRASRPSATSPTRSSRTGAQSTRS